MTRGELKTVKRGEFLYVPIITKHYGHSTGNSTIGNYDYSMCELFRLKVEDIRIFDYNDFLITNGRGYIIESIEKSKTEALQRRKNLEEKGELENWLGGWEKNFPLTPWWYGVKTIIVKFDLSTLDDETQKQFDETYRNYHPTFFSDTGYLEDNMNVYKKYLSFHLTGRDGVVINEDDFKNNETYSYRALTLFSKTKKDGQNIVKNENHKWLKYIDNEIEFLKKVKKDLVKISKNDGVLI